MVPFIFGLVFSILAPSALASDSHYDEVMKMWRDGSKPRKEDFLNRWFSGRCFYYDSNLAVNGILGTWEVDNGPAVPSVVIGFAHMLEGTEPGYWDDPSRLGRLKEAVHTYSEGLYPIREIDSGWMFQLDYTVRYKSQLRKCGPYLCARILGGYDGSRVCYFHKELN